MTRPSRGAWALILGLACAGCGDRVPEEPTYNQHVAAILNDRCAQCHRPDGAAPFPLLSYADVAGRSARVAAATRSRHMPPWLPQPGDFPFADERRLTEREIATLERWDARGAPEGEGVAPAARLEAVDEWMLGEPDLIVEMPEAYTVPAGGEDAFRNFVLPIPLDETRYVRAVELQPGNPMLVHHVVMAVDPTSVAREEDARDAEPGYDGMLARGSGRPPGGFFVGWTPGHVARPNPEGLSWALEPGTDLVLQMHLRPHGEDMSVRARVGFWFDNSPPERKPVLLRLGGQTLDIPAGASDYRVTDSLRVPVDIEVLGLYPHAHYIARTMDVHAVLPDGEKRTLLRIDEWDFNKQDSYTFARPVRLPAGTSIELRYVYDNSAANPRNPSAPPRRVVYGPASTDEMAELWIQALPRAREDETRLERAIADKAARDYVEGWRHLITLDPDDAMAHANLAAYHQAAGDLERSVDHYRRAVAAEPGFASAHFNLGIVLEARGERDEAIEHYRAALRARPDHAGAHNNLGNALLGVGKRADAAEQFRAAIALEPERVEARFNLGRMLWEDGADEEAVDQYRRALAVQPDAQAVRLSLALALASLGRADEALVHFDRLHETAPEQVETNLAMAWLLATHRDPGARRPDRARRLTERAAELLGQPHPRVLDVQAAVEAAAGRYDRAAELARDAVTLANGAGQRGLADEIGERLGVYLGGRPFIETRRDPFGGGGS